MAKLTAEQKQERLQGGKRARYVRQACYAWLEMQKPKVLAKIKELALKAHPRKSQKSSPDFVLDKELASMKE